MGVSARFMIIYFKMDALHDDNESSEWKLYTLKQLSRTLPFDSGTAIKFVRQIGDNESPCESCSISEGESNRQLTGEEARSIYESIVSSDERKNEELEHRPNVKRTNIPKKRLAMKTKGEPTVTLSTSLGSLFLYAQNGDLPSLSSALSSGCYDINVTDQFDWTLLMTAATAGHLSMVQYLLNNGATWENIVDKKKMDAVILAKLNHHYDIAEYIMQYRPKGFRYSQQLNRSDPGTAGTGEPSSSYICDICQQPVYDTPTSSHSVSICHQFSCQHKSSSLPYILPQTNKGFQMMVKSGWDPEKGLGSDGQGRKFPIKTVLKRDRSGVGITGLSNVPRVTHFRSGDISAIKSLRELRMKNKNPTNKKERAKQLRKERRWEIGLRQYMSTDY